MALPEHISRALVALTALCLVLMVGGCGYSAGLSMPEGTRTVGIEVFGNDGPLPNVERGLHEEMVRSVRNLVTGQIVDPSQADIVIRGNLDQLWRRGGLRTGDNQLRETGLLMRVSAELVSRDGKPAGRRTSSRVDVGYLNETLGAEGVARRRALKNIADGLVLGLFGREAPAEAPALPELLDLTE